MAVRTCSSRYKPRCLRTYQDRCWRRSTARFRRFRPCHRVPSRPSYPGCRQRPGRHCLRGCRPSQPGRRLRLSHLSRRGLRRHRCCPPRRRWDCPRWNCPRWSYPRWSYPHSDFLLPRCRRPKNCCRRCPRSRRPSWMSTRGTRTARSRPAQSDARASVRAHDSSSESTTRVAWSGNRAAEQPHRARTLPNRDTVILGVRCPTNRSLGR